MFPLFSAGTLIKDTVRSFTAEKFEFEFFTTAVYVKKKPSLSIDM